MRNEADPRAVARYKTILRTIRAAGMEPLVTLNHYSLPLWIHGGAMKLFGPTLAVARLPSILAAVGVLSYPVWSYFAGPMHARRWAIAMGVVLLASAAAVAVVVVSGVVTSTALTLIVLPVLYDRFGGPFRLRAEQVEARDDRHSAAA